jgi:hypothetical protein
MITLVCYLLAIPLIFITAVWWMAIHHPDELVGFLRRLEDQIDPERDDRDEDRS